jgi:hypothetical protein
MAEKELDALLSRMERIAAAVNGFSSEAVQQAAFAALVNAFGGSPPGSTTVGPAATHQDNSGEKKQDEVVSSAGDVGAGGKKSNKKKSTASGGKDFKVVKDLDLRPADKKAFEDFVAEKQPKSNEDKYAVAVYYLQHILELPAVTWHHVATVFRLTSSWREPADATAGLRVTSSRKATIDTTDLDNIKVTPQGRNFVEHDLPPKAKAGKK